MDEDEIRRSATLEQRHWWYAGRRAFIRRELRDLTPGRALDVGAGSGGNAVVLRELGWDVVTVEQSPAAARLCRERGLSVVRGDARGLPFGDASFDLVLSTDMWEHVDNDAAAARETARVLRPGGRLLVAVPSDMRLWSAHDVALGHHRRYDRQSLTTLLTSAGLQIDRMWSWNVLLRPAAWLRRRRRSVGSESEMVPVNPVLNVVLRTVVRVESFLPVGGFSGVSLVSTAHRPSRP